ncbi:P-loop containing nucleoside triphosphate hydrolase protein [Pholiota molesta]|nr:P-loop containing nucleoside triphosphate hydrolase protein [Pholiota molesta]
MSLPANRSTRGRGVRRGKAVEMRGWVGARAEVVGPVEMGLARSGIVSSEKQDDGIRLSGAERALRINDAAAEGRSGEGLNYASGQAKEVVLPMILSRACAKRSFPLSSWLTTSTCGRRTAATATALKPAPPHDAAPSQVQYTLSEQDHLRLGHQRNIGVSAHIDSGKTTLTERILYYTGRIREIHEAGTRRKNMPLILLIPLGHVDFTIEVERALRVLDGAVLVLCAVAGVQSQTTTVDRQMRRYNVPRISFVNKMDRPGANPWRIVQQIRTKLRIPAAAVQVPIGVEDEFKGVVDLVHWKAIYNEGVKGVNVVVSDEIPESLLALAKEKRTELIEQLAEVDEDIGEKVLMDETPSNLDIADAIRRATISLKFSPVFMGSAIKNTGVQPLLDGVLAHDTNQPAGSPQVTLTPAAEAPLVGLAFKLEEGRFGQLTYMRVYQGTLKKSMQIFNARTGKKVKVLGWFACTDVESIGPGEICAMFGVECSSGDTFTDGSTSFSMTSMFVPEPVISLSLKPKGTETPNFSRALNRFQKEDPTFKQGDDHLGHGRAAPRDYVERMRREYNVDCLTGKPQVAFRETISAPAEFSYTHKKQTGGAGRGRTWRLSGGDEKGRRALGRGSEVSHPEGQANVDSPKNVLGSK